jgi:hypothetical protein
MTFLSRSARVSFFSFFSFSPLVAALPGSWKKTSFSS